ncbi:hypothetical protein EON63_12960, partial [archaeon]
MCTYLNSLMCMCRYGDALTVCRRAVEMAHLNLVRVRKVGNGHVPLRNIHIHIRHMLHLCLCLQAPSPSSPIP